VCHIVQLAITQRNILGYRDGNVVPYFQSEAVLKQQSAFLQQPAWSLKKDKMEVANFTQARECLRAILENAPDGEVPLPNVKRLFRSRFNVELSETALGASRISELLQGSDFSDICSMCARGNTYMVVRNKYSKGSADLARASSPEQGAEAEQEDAVVQEACDVMDEPSFWQAFAERTFIHFKASPATPARRSRSLPKDLGSGRHSDWSNDRTASSPSDADSTEASDSDLPSPRRLRFCLDEPLSLEEATSTDCEESVGCPLMTPSPQYDGTLGAMQVTAQSSKVANLDENLEFLRNLGLVGYGGIDAVVDAADSEGSGADVPRGEQLLLGVQPLLLEETEEKIDLPLATPSPQYHLASAPSVQQAALPMRCLTTCPLGQARVSRERSSEVVLCASMRSSHVALPPTHGGA